MHEHIFEVESARFIRKLLNQKIWSFLFSLFDLFLVFFHQRSEAELMKTESETETETDDSVESLVTVNSSGSIRTVIIFVDLPVHLEFRAGDMPLLSPGIELIFDRMTVRDRLKQRSRTIEGTYVVKNRVLKYGSRPGFQGLTQYLEMEPLKTGN